jgi:succinyl-CoA:(S)-malate CoA-transferase subunit B
LLRGREKERAAVDDYVGNWTARHDRADLLKMCEAAQVPCGPVYSIDEIFEDPQYAARENIVTVDDARVGKLSVPNVMPRLTETPGRIDRLGPDMGEHNDEFFRDRLGLSQSEIERLQAAGVI